MNYFRSIYGSVFLLVWVLALGSNPTKAEESPAAASLVQRIVFRTWRTLDSEDLSRPLPLKVGKPYQLQDLQASIERLFERGIFEHIDANVHQITNGVEIEFLLTPALTVYAVEFEGNNKLDERRLRRLAGATLDQPLNLYSLIAARDRLVRGYQREGYFHADVRLRILERVTTPQVIARFVIDEGEVAEISAADIEGELPEDIAELPKRLEQVAVGLPASEGSKKNLRQELLSALRAEGYLQASVEVVSGPPDPETGKVKLTFQVQSRSPISIVFVGNTVFSTSELLEPLRLETRTVPFTPSAIENLCKEIETMYQAKGYFFADVQHQPLAEQGPRRVFEVRINEGRQVRLRKIELAGNSAFGDSEVLAVMESRPPHIWPFNRWEPGYLSKESVSNDLGAIEALYQRAGYLNVTTGFELRPVENSDELDLIVSIEEGNLRPVESVQVTWEGLAQPTGSAKTDYSVLTLQPSVKSGQPFNYEEFQVEQNRLTTEIRELGYPNATVELIANPETREVEFLAKPGPLVTVRNIHIAGNFFTHDHVIERELRIFPGHVLRPSDLRKTEQSLYELGIFRSVSVHSTDGNFDSSEEDITVQVAERDTGSLQLETGFNTEDGLHLAGELAQRNLGGTGEALVLSIDGYFKTGSRLFDAGNARARFTEPRLLDTQADLFTELYAQYSIELVDPFSYDRFGASTTIRVPISEKLSSSSGFNVFLEDLFDVPADVIIDPNDAERTFYSFFNTQMEWDGRDNKYNPRMGQRMLVQARVASETIGSEVNFLAAGGQETVYLPISPRLVWVNSARGDYMMPFGDTEVIPLSQRIFLGGRNTLRGFSKNVIGPRGVEGNIAGGDVSLVLNTELQYDLMENIIGLIFLDAGQTYLLEEGSFEGLNRDFSELRYSPGFGLRYKTPIGPVSLEVGLALDREFGERWGRVNFAVGNAF